ncbi:MAG: MarR family transcriptional regulator [Deltaproteobacteria bacterium]|jgi:DNA-binding MarR family transcriptional regulator|nr:MarR family transcriptional regulator [Deltaproteobacteria bacterium]
MNQIPPADLFPDLSQRLLRCLLRLSRQLRTAKAESTLPSVPLQALGILYRNRRATATELAAELGIKKQSLTLLLAALHERGYTERKKDAGDARKVHLALTPAGREVFLSELRGRRARLAALIADRLTGNEAEFLLAVLPVLEKLAGTTMEFYA